MKDKIGDFVENIKIGSKDFPDHEYGILTD
jgi:hypothetical protein